MSSLFKNLRIHQIFGSNTDVGKTILTTGLVKASAVKNIPVFYLKPISTGPPEEADEEHIKRYAKSNLVDVDCLFRFSEPVSPHLAAKLAASNDIAYEISDKTTVNTIAERIRQYAGRGQRNAHMYLETAGGVHSPSISGTSQADCYRPLFLPTILIGDSKLGGISSTISSYESLLLRGYIIDAVLLFRDHYYRNWEYLEPYFASRNIHLYAIDPPPPRHPDHALDRQSTQKYYDDLIADPTPGGIPAVVDHLDRCHAKRLDELSSMPKRTLNSIWWPFVQHGLSKTEKDVTVIDSAHSDFFSVSRQDQSDDTRSLLTPEFDGSASWWTQTVGHSHPSLTLAAARASGRYGHVMFPQAIHLPALNLAERLLRDGPGKGWASRVFFSDNGSTGMEVALKMALRAYCVRNNLSEPDKKRLGVIGLHGSYHGDTIGVMDACAEGVYSCEWHDAKGFWFDAPTIGIKSGNPAITLTQPLNDLFGERVLPAPSLSWIYDIESRLQTPLAATYRTYIRKSLEELESKGQKFGALVLEPLLMGAGGMKFVDPLFQRIMVDVVRSRAGDIGDGWSGLPVIFDEVLVGLHRIGVESANQLLGVHPDISVNAKILTGGLVPLAVTLASESIFKAFWSDSKANALLHGHSYTAHAIGCEVSNETLKLIDGLKTSNEWKTAQTSWSDDPSLPSKIWSFWDPGFVHAISELPNVENVMALGCVLAIILKSGIQSGYVSMSAQVMFEPLKKHIASGSELSAAPGGAPFTTHYRTLGNVAYFMTSLNTSCAMVRSMEDKIWRVLRDS